MSKIYFTLLLTILFFGSVFSQKTCGFDQIHQELLKSNDNYKLELQKFENAYQIFKNEPIKRGGVYKIPVVVHVMETGNSLTVITDQQIKDALKALNEKYRKISGSLGDGNGVDITIEFALAVRDPNNNCTNGINRYDMSNDATYMSDGVKRSTSGISDATLKSYISWNQTKYYNIWLVSEIDNNEGGAGVQGYAYFASSHGSSTDGAVILVNSFKDVQSNTASHELGHAFNLYHTFEGDQDANGNSQCPINSNCSSDGDKVCDTPPHKRSNSDCVVGTNSCDNNSSTSNFIHNYMDYSSDVCANEFTAGQKVRMLAALTTSRASFLESNGNMSLVPVSTPALDFVASSEYVCTGGSVTFYDKSTCIPNTYIDGDPWTNISYLWTITSGNFTTTSTKQTPQFTLSTSGVYDVTMSVTTVLGTQTLTKKGIIVVGASPKTACTPTSSNNGNYWCTLNNVTFNTINKTTDNYINDGYSNFTCSDATILKPGGQYSFSAKLRSNNYAEVVEAYIDYNNNSTFENTELIFSGSIPTTSFSAVSGSVTIPNTAVTDQPLRMRVFAEANTLSSQERSCSASLFVGDVEDYTVYISSKVASVSLAVSPSNSITYGTSVTFTATPTNGGSTPQYQWYLNGSLVIGEINSTYTNSTLLEGDQVYCVLVSDLIGVTNSPASSNTISMTVLGTPISDFSISNLTPCTNSSVLFTDDSKLAPTSWNWTFQGGTPSTSTSQNPSVTFANPGNYTVTLTASNANGTGTTMTKTGVITVYSTPTSICSNFVRTKNPSAGVGITAFSFNDINNSNAYNDAVYQDFSCSNKTELAVSTSYQISISTGASNNQWLRVYIDYNGDGDFNDAGETVLSPANAKSLFSGTITTPASPVKDKVLRMRVITDFTNTSPGACTTSLEYGQVEDYGVIFKSVACTNPSAPTVSVTNPSCNSSTGSVAITSSTSGLTFSTDGINYVAYTTPFSFAPGVNYSITAKNTGGCVSSATTGSIGTLPNYTTPSFTQVSAICSGATLTALPTTSSDNIVGTWSPALNNSKTTTYTFTPNSGQCANTTTMTITVNSVVNPSFTQVASICSGATLNALPTTSSENILGTWSPALDNSKTTTYTFTPNQGQCANNATMTITVNPIVNPSFTQVASICSGATLNALLTTSLENILGTWSPSLDNSKTTTYTFTPNQGQCANNATMTITVNPIVTPAFTQIAPICSGAILNALPTTSSENILGAWSPALDNSKTTTYTFTPNSDQCANNTTMTITVNPIVTPSFSQVSAICTGATLTALPTTSKNNVIGTWSPALDNSKTTTYTFTPNQGQCSDNTTMTITVNSSPITPTFTVVNSICEGDVLVSLPVSSLENVTGNWSPTLDNKTTTTYTFTPNPNQCSNSTSVTITVNKIPDAGNILSVNEYCLGKTNTISTTVSGGVWTISNDSVATINQNGLFTTMRVGQVDLIYTVTQNNCSSSISKTFTINDCALITNESIESVLVYPNPTQNELHIKHTSATFNSFMIIDNIGKVVKEGKLTSGKEFILNISNLSTGQYVLRLESNEGEVKHINFGKN